MFARFGSFPESEIPRVVFIVTIVVYAGAGFALRIGETQEAVAMFQRRLLRRRAAAKA